MAPYEYSFTTSRLHVAEWHSVANAGSLRGLVQQLLSPNVVAPLPEAWRGPYSESRAEGWIRERDAEGTALLVESRASGECIGLLLLHESKAAANEGLQLRLGYLIAESEWGKGYATELVRGFVQWARSGPYGSVIAGVAADNRASQRVLEKSGFSLTQRVGEEHFYTIQC